MKDAALLIAADCWLLAGPTPFFERPPERYRNETKYESQIVRWPSKDMIFCSSRPMVMDGRYSG